MKENSKGVSPSIVANLTKEAIISALEESYANAKPINDKMVDISVHIQTLTAEIYRRAIFKNLPSVPLKRIKTILKLSTSVHPNKGLPLMLQRLNELSAQEIEITSISYDESTGEFSFYGKPEFEFPVINPPTQ